MMRHSSQWPIRRSCRPFPITLGNWLRIILASADSLLLANWLNSIRCRFGIIKVVTGGSSINTRQQHFMIAHALIPAYVEDPLKTPLVQHILAHRCCWHLHSQHSKPCSIIASDTRWKTYLYCHQITSKI